MNNIQKAFKRKSELRAMADGGDVGRIMYSRDMSIFTPEEKKTFNAMGAAAREQGLAIQQAGHRAALDAAANVAPPQMNFGVSTAGLEPPEQELADGGKVKGKGGPTDDKVGPVALSNGEYVLPADTVKAIGVETLDALRLATHDFKDAKNRPKIPGRLRGMASGGVFYVDSEGNASRGVLPGRGRAMVPAQPQPQPQPAAPAGGASAATPQSGGGSALRNARNALNEVAKGGGGRMGGLARGLLGAAPIQMTVGALSTLGDHQSGFRDEYNRALGIDHNASLPKQIAGDTARVMESVGNALTGGYAGKLGRGLSSLAAGGSFMEGWNSPSQRELFAAGPNPPTATAAAAPAQPQTRPNDAATYGMPNPSPALYSNQRLAAGDMNSRYASAPDDTVIGTFNGRPITKGEADARGASLQTVSGMQLPRQPSDPFMEEMRSALRNLGGGGGGGWAPPSREREINERFDRLANQLSGMYSRKGQGNLARRLLELEQARSAALDADARNQSSLRGQDVSAQTANLNARMSALSTLGTLEAQRRRDAAAAAANAAKAAEDAAKAAEERSKDAMASMNDAIDRYSAGDKDLAADLARVASTIPAELRAAIDALPASDRPGAWASVFDAYTGQNRGLVAGRDVGATVQNTLLGGGVGAAMPGIGRTIGTAGDLAVTALSRGNYRGSVLRNLLGSRIGSAALGAGVGALATPEVQVSGRLDLPVVSEDGLPIPADATFVEGFKHGFFDTNKPWANLHRGESGKLQASDYSDDELAAIRDLSTLRRFGRE